MCRFGGKELCTLSRYLKPSIIHRGTCPYGEWAANQASLSLKLSTETNTERRLQLLGALLMISIVHVRKCKKTNPYYLIHI